MKYSEMDEKWKEKSDGYIHSRWKQLNDLTREYTTYATKYCFATNAGGAVALLSYFGVVGGALDLPNLKYALCIFLVGILFAAGPILILLHEFVHLLREWGIDSRKFRKGAIGYKVLLENDDRRIKESTAAWVTGYISLGCFAVGILWTMGQFLWK